MSEVLLYAPEDLILEEKDFFIHNLLVQIHFIIERISVNLP